MGKDLIVSSDRRETKVALLEDEVLVEVYFQRANEYSLVGSIHKGRVTRVLPGMQSAFVNVGLDRDAFLYVSDFFEESEEYEPIAVVGTKPRRVEREREVAPAAVREEANSADRRGRRGRRRRNRGRGFPESKYSTEPAQEVVQEPVRVEE
jgi:ribonuclease G